MENIPIEALQIFWGACVMALVPLFYAIRKENKNKTNVKGE